MKSKMVNNIVYCLTWSPTRGYVIYSKYLTVLKYNMEVILYDMVAIRYETKVEIYEIVRLLQNSDWVWIVDQK